MMREKGNGCKAVPGVGLVVCRFGSSKEKIPSEASGVCVCFL